MANGELTSSLPAADDFDRRNADWYIDKGVQALVFIGGISAIIFIIGIFVFISKEALGFIANNLDVVELFGDPRDLLLALRTAGPRLLAEIEP